MSPSNQGFFSRLFGGGKAEKPKRTAARKPVAKKKPAAKKPAAKKKPAATKKPKTREQLYKEATRLKIAGRTKMSKAQLERAIARKKKK